MNANAGMEFELLGMLLLKNGAVIPTVSAILTADDFSDAVHKIIYRNIISTYEREKGITFQLLVDELKRNDDFEKVGNAPLISLGQQAFSTAYAETYAQKIKEKSVLRQLVTAGEQIAKLAGDTNKPLEEILDDAEKLIFNLTVKSGGAVMEIIHPIAKRAFEQIQLAVENGGQLTGVKCGFSDLDSVTNGLQKSDLILIAARPSMGKTAFAMNLALNAAMRDNRTVAVFSLEMSREQLAHRVLSAVSGVDSEKMKAGKLQEDELLELAMALDRLADVKLFIDDTGAISVMELRSKVRKFKAEYGLDLIVIDYIQLMRGKKSENRVQEVSEISRQLKALAKELNVPVIALSQLSRNTELRADKRPILSDLRESGSLEQDADIVIFLYRDDYYNRESDAENIEEVIIAKNRNGRTMTSKLYFQKECSRFGDLLEV